MFHHVCTRNQKGLPRGSHPSARNSSRAKQGVRLRFSVAWSLAAVLHFFWIARSPQLSQSTTNLSCTSQLAWPRRSTLSVETERLRSRTPSDVATWRHVCFLSGFWHCRCPPAFSSGFTSRRTVFDAPLAWPPGWANNMPLRFISEVRSLGDQLLWLVGLPPERFVTRRLLSLRTASNADER